MKTSLKIEPTMYLNINGQPVRVSTLSKEIQYEIETLDRMRQDMIDIAYNYECMSLSIKAKEGIIKIIIDKEFSDNQPTDTTSTEVG